MPSFFVRNLARLFAVSYMSKTSRSSTSATTSISDKIAEGVGIWNKEMRWLIPFVQASGYRIVIENPKSHEEIVIDKDTKDLPCLSLSWLNRYDKKEVDIWIAKMKELEEARRMAEVQGQKKFGDGYKASEQDIKEILSENSCFKTNKVIDYIEERVKDILVETLGVSRDECTPEADIQNDLNASSFDTVELIMKAEEEFSISINDKDVNNIHTVKQAIDYIKMQKTDD